jgi:hypothetical protein
MTRIAKFLVAIALICMVISVERIMEARWLPAYGDGRNDSTRIPQKGSVMAERETVTIVDVIGKNPRLALKGELWTFDRFTSPTIRREGTGFKSIFPWMEKNQLTINFEVVRVEKKLYPLQFSGYFTQPTADGQKSKDPSFSFRLSDL